MSDLLEGVLGQLGPGGLTELAKGLGADEGAIGSAVSAAIPAILLLHLSDLMILLGSCFRL